VIKDKDKGMKNRKENAETFSPTSMALGALLLGASAGLVLYTKRTGQLLTQIDRAQASQNARKGISPEKYKAMKRKMSKDGMKR